MAVPLFSLFVAASAGACTLTAKPFMVGCGSLASLAAGASCKLSCLKTYRSTVTSVSCTTGGVLSTSTYVCVPIQQSLFPWRSAQCSSVTFAGAGFAGYNVASFASTGTFGIVSAGTDEYKLTDATSGAKGVYGYGPLRTRGARSAFEFSFMYKAAASAGGDGFWAVLTTGPATAGNTPASKGPLDVAGSTSSIMALEIDFFTDASPQLDTVTVPHIAVLFATAGSVSETHSATYSNLVGNIGTAASIIDGNYHTANVLVQPVSTSGNIIVTVWNDGLTIVRDTILSANVPALLATIINTKGVVYINTYAYNRAGVTAAGIKTVKTVKVCGVESAQLWSRYYVVSRVRTCAQVGSFGNPDPVRPGVWKPFACPASGVVRASPLPPTITPG